MSGSVESPPAGSHTDAPTAERARAEAIDSSRFIVAVHVASLAVGFLVLLVATRGQWFKNDDWSYIVFRSLPSDLAGVLFDPYNGHWSTAPILQFRAVFSVFGLRSYAPYLVPVLLLQVGVAHVLWRLMRQMAISSWIATALAATFLVNGGTANVWFAPMQSGFVGGLLLGLIVTMLANHTGRDRRRDAVAIGVAVLSLTFSGVVIPVVVGGVIVAFLRRGWRAAVGLALPAAAAYLLWFAIWGHTDVGGDSLGLGDLAHLPDFVWSGLRTTIERATPLGGVLAALVVFALAGWLVLHWRGARGDAAPAFALAIAGVLLYLVIASQRLTLFVAKPTIPDRYVYITWALLIPAVGLALHELAGRTSVRRVIAVILGAVLLVGGVRNLRHEYNEQSDRAQAVQATMLGATAFAARAPYLPRVIVDHDSADGVTPVHLLDLERRGDLPALPALTPAVRRAAAIRVQVRFSRTATAPGLDRGISAGVGSDGGATPSPASGSCLRVGHDDEDPEVALVVDRRATISVRAERRGELRVRLEGVDGAGGAVSDPQSLRPGRPLFVQFARDTRPVLLLPPDGSSTVCRLDVAD